MISVKDAESIIIQNVHPEKQPAQSCELKNLQGEVLREEIISDRPLPPFHRVAMDGIAICFESWKQGRTSFPSLGDHRAGDPMKALGEKDKCWEVMTGSVLPEGCDCVIKVEDILVKDGVAHLQEGLSVERHQHVHLKGTDCPEGTVLLQPGVQISAAQTAIIASVGKTKVQISQRPRVAILSTGDELVEVDVIPEPHQIRRSNVYGISASLEAYGFFEIDRHHLPDHKEEMLQYLNEILKNHEVVILSGGVSKGKFDFVPEVLTELGVERKFHKVRQRPGKPLWFGVGAEGQLVFGLPGNPVSAVVCLHRYVLPALLTMVGEKPLSDKNRKRAVLQKPLQFKNPLTLFQPVSISYNDLGQIMADPISTNGSGDFSSLAESDGFIELNESKDSFQPGEVYPLWTWRA